MKTIKHYIMSLAILLIVGGCDKDFVEVNTDPYQINDLDPALVFAGSQRVGLGGWEQENTIVQQFVNPYDLGATRSFNFNEPQDNHQNGQWNNFTGSIRTFVHILEGQLGEDTERINLQSMVRIWKAYVFMMMVDAYGDVPYFDAGLAALRGEDYFFPAYDDQEAIYQDLRNELVEAVDNLDPNGEFVAADVFYGQFGQESSTTAAESTAKWKKLGNSILLRLGMRYSKSNPTLASQIVAEALDPSRGGVIDSNSGSAYVTYDGTNFTNGANGGLINNQPYYYYAAEPFVDQLKNSNDPRGKYILANFDDPGDPQADTDPDYTYTDMFGVPFGVKSPELSDDPAYRGEKLTGLNYTQMNVNVVASILAPTFWVTNAQTSLLMAEAAVRGWGGLNPADAQMYYENAIQADMDAYSIYLNATGNVLPDVTGTEYNDYITHPNVDFSAAATDQERIDLINLQYWIVNIRDGREAWANMRRTNYFNIAPNPFIGELDPAGDGYVHRFTWPDIEATENSENYAAAVQKIGSDDMDTRIFWDVP